MDSITEPKIFKREVEIVVSPQAQMVLAGTKYTVDEFLHYELNIKRISFGGHNVTMFLEEMYKQGDSR